MRFHRWTLLVILTAVLVVVGGLIAFWPPASVPGTVYTEIVPQLNPQVADLLAAPRDSIGGTDDALAAYFAESGMYSLRIAAGNLTQAIRNGTPSERRFLLPALARLAVISERDFHTGFSSKMVAVLSSTPDTTLDLVADLVEEGMQMLNDASLPNDIKLVRQKELVAEFRSLGYSILLPVFQSHIAQTQISLGRRDLYRAEMRRALANSQYFDWSYMICQYAGSLAFEHFFNGERDSVEYYLTMLEDRARRARIADQAARALGFRASFEMDEGRWGSAYLYLRDSRRVFHDMRGGDQELRIIVALADFLAKVGCWSRVDDLIAQAEHVIPNHFDPRQVPYIAGIRLLEARSMFHKGRQEEAFALATQVAENYPPRPSRGIQAACRRRQAHLLLAGGQADAAIKTLEDGLALTDSDRTVDLGRSLLLLLAQAYEQKGMVGAAQRTFDRYRAIPLEEGHTFPDEVALEAYLDVRLTTLQEGDGPELAAALSRAFALTRSEVTNRDPSTHSYLNLANFNALRWLVHELIATDAQLGRDFELIWRGLLHGRSFPAADLGEAADAKAWLRNWRAAADSSQGDVRPIGGATESGPRTVHLVYLVTDDAIMRWQTDHRGVTRQQLDLPPGTMRRTVANAVAGLSTPPPAGAAEDLNGLGGGALQELARTLLPPDLREDIAATTEPIRLLLTVDDALARLPFEALDVDPGPAYAALNEGAEVIYLKYRSVEPRRRVDQRTIVVVDTSPPAVVTRLLDGWESLPGARQEATHVMKSWTPAVILAGAEATKQNLTSFWEDASRIYFATHVVRDAQVPYINLLPMSGAPEEPRLAAALLETGDVQRADLTGCELVVLAGCSSGSPYVEGTMVAPGLGDAFLSAGSRSVIHTLWNIDDAVTEQFMGFFLEAVGNQTSPNELARALRSARRSTQRLGGQMRHPFAWAGFCLATTDDSPSSEFDLR